MADNIAITAGSGTTIATDDISSVHYQRVKVSLGADGTANDLNVGAGAVATGTPRVTLASDDPAVASLAVLDNIVSGSEAQVDVVAALPAGTNNIGDVDVLTVPADPFGANADAAATAGSTGSIQAKLRLVTSQLDSIKTAVETLDNAISGSEMQVDVVGALPAGANAIGKLAANSGVDIGDVDILSIAAGDNNIGNVDVASIAAGTNAIGKLLPPDVDVTANTNYAKKYYTNAGAVTDGIIWSPAAGKRWHIHTIYINVSAAATVTLEDDKAGGDEAIWKGELAANSGVVMTFPEKYPWASGEDAADLIITTSAGNVYVTVSGFEV